MDAKRRGEREDEKPKDENRRRGKKRADRENRKSRRLADEKRPAGEKRGGGEKRESRKRTDGKRRAGKKRTDGRKRAGRKRTDGKARRGSEDKGERRKQDSREGGSRVVAAFREGGRAERNERGDTPKSIGTRALAAIAAFAAALVAAARTAAKTLAGLFERLLGPRSALGRRVRSVLGAASRALTPARGLLVAAIGCALLLGLSQFADYRGIAIGVDNYDLEVSSVAPAPELDRKELGTAHSYVMIPAALIAIAILLVAVRTRRRRLCRLAALIGLGAIAVSLFVDRPAGLDEGAVADSFAGAEAQLLGGWWAQLFAGFGLIVTSLMLGTELRRGGERSRAPARRSRRPTGSSVGKRGKHSGRRSRPGAEGAGA